MKIGAGERVVAAKSAEVGGFKEALRKAPPSGAVPGPQGNPDGRTARDQVKAMGALVGGPRPVPASPPLWAGGPRPVPYSLPAHGSAETERLGANRMEMHAEASRQGLERQEAQTDGRQKGDARLAEGIVRELLQDGYAEPKPRPASESARPEGAMPPAPAQVGGPARPGAAEAAAVRAASALELIEKIDLFVKAHRPALAMTLAGGKGAWVEIERLGPNEVAVTVKGKKGPPSPEELTRIRDEIRARGLKLTSLAVS